MMLQVNKSKPLYAIGEQAYGYAEHGSAWITFQSGTVFGQLNVGVAVSRKLADPSPDEDAITNDAFEIAKRFAFYLAQSATVDGATVRNVAGISPARISRSLQEITVDPKTVKLAAKPKDKLTHQ